MIGTLTAVASSLTALVGLFVAALAYRGYRRNDSRTMRALAVGLVLVAVAPYVVTYVAAPLFSLSDAETILGVTLAHAAGLFAIYRSFG